LFDRDPFIYTYIPDARKPNKIPNPKKNDEKAEIKRLFATVSFCPLVRDTSNTKNQADIEIPINKRIAAMCG
jgi:hypothetical protein